MDKKSNGEKIVNADEILDRLEDLLLSRVNAFRDAAEFCRERHDPNCSHNTQGAHTYLLYLGLVRQARRCLSGDAP